MFGKDRFAVLAAVLLSLGLGASPARAWVEQTTLNDSATIDVERDGSATVSQQVLMRVRGGPVPTFSLDPVEADAELLEGASVVRAESGKAASVPIPLSATREGPKVTLRVAIGKGIRSGSYLVQFRYRTHLLVEPGPRGTEIQWSGPSISDGIDSERVVFRLPRASQPPRLPAGEGGEGTDIVDGQNGVFLSTVRHASDRDEIEIVRPHVAKSEIVTWRIVVDRAALDLLDTAPKTEPVADAPEPVSVTEASPVSTPAIPPRIAPRESSLLLVTAAFAAFAALLVFAKSRLLSRSGIDKVRPLAKLPTVARVALTFAAAFGASYCVVERLSEVLAAASFVLVLALATYLPPSFEAPRRGPGQWVPVDPEASLREPTKSSPPARLFDVGCASGFAFFAALLALFVVAAVLAARHAAYDGVAVALGSAILFPTFFTGRALHPLDVARSQTRDLLSFLLGILSKNPSVTTELRGRLPLGGTMHDELRVDVRPSRAVVGFVALEVGLDVHAGRLGTLALPFVIVRVLEGTPGADRLPKGLLWTRGRTPDERVTVLRPKIPTERALAELALDLCRHFGVKKDPVTTRSRVDSPERASSSTDARPEAPKKSRHLPADRARPSVLP